MNDLQPIQKAAYILDHGWELVPQATDGKLDCVYLYKTWQRPFLTGVNLEIAFDMQKTQEDETGNKCPLEEAKKYLAEI